MCGFCFVFLCEKAEKGGIWLGCSAYEDLDAKVCDVGYA